MLKETVEWCKPTRGTKHSACIDLYAKHDCVIGAGDTEIINLGVCIDIDMDTHMGNRRYGEEYKINKNPTYGEGAKKGFDEFKSSHYLQLNPRSSIRAKGLISHTGIIDLDFTQEIKMIIHNPIIPISIELDNGFCYTPSDFNDFYIKKGDKIGQITLIEHKGYLLNIESGTERTGGIGSTDEI